MKNDHLSSLNWIIDLGLFGYRIAYCKDFVYTSDEVEKKYINEICPALFKKASTVDECMNSDRGNPSWSRRNVDPMCLADSVRLSLSSNALHYAVRLNRMAIVFAHRFRWIARRRCVWIWISCVKPEGSMTRQRRWNLEVFYTFLVTSAATGRIHVRYNNPNEAYANVNQNVP